MTLPLTIQSSQPTQVVITLSGITILEYEFLQKNVPRHYTLTRTLTTSTSYLVVSRPIFSEKYICALQWNIPIIHISFLYNTHVPVKSFLITPFQNMKFTIEDVNNPIFKNYFVCQGAVYVENMRIDLDFLIADGENERKKFADKYGIPVIRTSDVFRNNYRKFQKKNWLFALRDMSAHKRKDAQNREELAQSASCGEDLDGKTHLEMSGNDAKIFKDKIFYLDSDYLSKKLIHHLKKLIIENGGFRLSHGAKNTDYVISENDLSFEFIFHCIENGELLLPALFQNNSAKPIRVLEGCTFIVTTKYNEEINNKIRAMGGRIKDKYDYTVTHFVTEHEKLRKNAKCVSKEWIDKCLYLMKKCEERICILRLPTRQTVSYNMEKEIVVQFTGLPPDLKAKLKMKLDALNIKYMENEQMKGVTHLISANLATSEKFLCAMVSGIPIIKPDVADNDLSSLMWTEEDADEKDKKIVRAVKYWRGLIRKSHRLPFSGWRVKLFCVKSRLGSYRRVLECGGAEIVETQWTHSFKSKDYKEIIDRDAHVRTTDHIFSYLFSRIQKND